MGFRKCFPQIEDPPRQFSKCFNCGFIESFSVFSGFNRFLSCLLAWNATFDATPNVVFCKITFSLIVVIDLLNRGQMNEKGLEILRGIKECVDFVRGNSSSREVQEDNIGIVLLLIRVEDLTRLGIRQKKNCCDKLIK